VDGATIRGLLEQQDGVIARWQILAAGGRDSDIARLVRRRLFARVHDGVYVNHTGPLTTGQRRWAAVLHFWPAALCHESALGGPSWPRAVDDVVHVAIDSKRRVGQVPGVVVHRMRSFEVVALMNLSPPRVRIEQAVLDVASGARFARQAVGVLADAVQSRRTTAARLLAHLDELPRLPRRRLLAELLADVTTGTYSVLERIYLRDVERPHALPAADRQRRVGAGQKAACREVEYPEQRLVVELDGRLGHEWSADRWADLDRDVSAAVDRRLTIRLGYGQVAEPCRVAQALVSILLARGWAGPARACGPQCPVRAVCGDSHSPGEGNSPRTA